MVGVVLLKRGGVKHHAFHRERKRFTFERTVPLAEVQHSGCTDLGEGGGPCDVRRLISRRLPISLDWTR